MSAWVAWVEPIDRHGYSDKQPRCYVRRVLPSLQLTKSRERGERYPTSKKAERVARLAAYRDTRFGAEGVADESEATSPGDLDHAG